ncbi:hypothetical protein EV138_0007 [Kribbella voronezhensis]|uniref:Secreted protein n=1 Tax=Kribbella voronezhensis TaxID=2512212 RepID=A0A4R7T617_9ACTN|nr:hypothetical protein [Kribbella voronezhensis]TDU86498.1 hypothetical protein EV138_0007 [Kribbella voronezhensis]
MRNRVARGFIALSTVLGLLIAMPSSLATADTVHSGDRVCSMYANSVGFGAYCSNGQVSDGPAPPPWKDRLQPGQVFVPCRDFEVPKGIKLPDPPEGKQWVLRLTIVQYDLNSNFGGVNAHLERAIVPVSEEERKQCMGKGTYMDKFWTYFDESYPDPVLQVNPTYTPRVNIPAYFTLTPESSYVLKNFGTDLDIANYAPGERLTMRALVSQIEIDPGDGTGKFTCLGGVLPVGSDGYDETKDPFHQVNPCSHVYKRSSASQPDGMYTVKLTITWQVDYWRNNQDWKNVDHAKVHAVQRLPVQEVQAIGG